MLKSTISEKTVSTLKQKNKKIWSEERLRHNIGYTDNTSIMGGCPKEMDLFVVRSSN